MDRDTPLSTDSTPCDLHIASCVIRTVPARLPTLAAELGAREDVQVYAHDDHAKLVVILEGDSTASLLDQMDALRQINGVVSVEMVYQHAEDQSAMKEKIPCQ